MSFKELFARLAALAARRDRERDLREELAFHRDMLDERARRTGLAPAAARREARLALGGEQQIIEAWHDQRGLPLLDMLGQDLRYGFRLLRRSPGFAATAIATLALGIGACTAIFSIVDAVLFRPLPFADSDRLVTVGDRNPNGSAANAGFQTMT